MKTEPDDRLSQKRQLNKTINDDNFVNLINILSDSIREYFKVTINVNKNESILLNSCKKEINNSESIINNILSEEINNSKINSYNSVINTLREILKNLQLNILSNQKNLTFFFEDAKVLFKKMKEERQKLIINIQKRVKSTQKLKEFSNLSYKINNFNSISEINQKFNIISKDNDNTRKQQNTLTNARKYNLKINEKEQKIPSKSFNKGKDENLLEENDLNNNSFHTRGNNNANQQNKEIGRLTKLNKNYELQIKKLNMELKNIQNKNNIVNSPLKNEKQNKDKLILSLRENLKKNNLKYNQLLNNYNSSQNLLKKLQDENNQLKLNRYSTSSNNDAKNTDQDNLSNKIKYLMKENNILKNQLDSLNKFNLTTKSDINFSLANKDENLNNIEYFKKQIELFKKKISSLDKKLLEEQKVNKQLLSENILLKKQGSNPIEFSKRNNEISQLLIEIDNLKKEIIDKNKEIQNLKSNGNINENQQNNLLNNNFGDSMNKALENYKNENNNLKTDINALQDKINYYKTQNKKIKDDLYLKIQTNIELQNNNEKKINDMKIEYEKKFEEINKKNKSLESNLEECQNFNKDLVQQINDLNQQIIEKDIKILELKFQKEQFEKKLSNNQEENKISPEELTPKGINNNENENQEIILLKENLEEQKIKNSDLNDELAKIKNDNEILSKKILSYEKNKLKEENKNKDINNELYKEIEGLKKENFELKNNNEKLNKEINEIMNKNIINENNSDILKGQNEELERLKQLNIQYENEINLLKKENEKIKGQLIRLSKTLPEEYNELYKEYNTLETKYKNLLKNNNAKSEANQNIIQNANNTKNDENLNELNKAKKEIEIIKKKNMELIKQLEEKEIKKDCYDNKSEQNVSNYEEEFDLKKMAKGAKDKNRSQDINIDYPGIQNIKEKYRELDFYYNSLEGLVKKLLLNIYCNPKNKTYVTELCKIVGFDLETTNKIVNNKNKNFILGLFNK